MRDFWKNEGEQRNSLLRNLVEKDDSTDEMLVVSRLTIDEGSNRFRSRFVSILRVDDDESARELGRLVLVVVGGDGAVEYERVREQDSFQFCGSNLESSHLRRTSVERYEQ